MWTEETKDAMVELFKRVVLSCTVHEFIPYMEQIKHESDKLAEMAFGDQT